MDTKNRVVVTGIGVVSPVGKTVDQFWNSLVNGISGIAPITLCDPSPFPCKIAGEVKDFDPSDYMDLKLSLIHI